MKFVTQIEPITIKYDDAKLNLLQIIFTEIDLYYSVYRIKSRLMEKSRIIIT